MFSERQTTTTNVIKSISMEKTTAPAVLKPASMRTTATSINYGSIKQSPFLSGALP